MSGADERVAEFFAVAFGEVVESDAHPGLVIAFLGSSELTEEIDGGGAEFGVLDAVVGLVVHVGLHWVGGCG